MVDTWIHTENLRSFMTLLARYAGTTFEEGDWARLERDLIVFDDQPDEQSRVDWPLGEATLECRHTPAGTVVSFRLDADAELELRAATLADVMQVFERPDYREQQTQPPPEPWRVVPSLHVGGLTDVGFADDHQGRELLLVVSHSGRGVFDLTGTRLARDPDPLPGNWHDAPALTAQGIGPLDGVRVSIAGLWGGGFPLTTRDHWSVAHEDDGRVVLEAPDGRSRLIHHETFFEIRAVGFSPSGRALAIATVGECHMYTRSEARDPAT